MLNWNDVIRLVNHGETPNHPKRVEKTDEEWKGNLNNESYLSITRKKARSDPINLRCTLLNPENINVYVVERRCLIQQKISTAVLGWPSFTQPIATENVALHQR